MKATTTCNLHNSTKLTTLGKNLTEGLIYQQASGDSDPLYIKLKGCLYYVYQGYWNKSSNPDDTAYIVARAGTQIVIENFE